ncbi:MAG: ABC transporter ATP-binding protein [Candidatus Dormibacterales bacterium]
MHTWERCRPLSEQPALAVQGLTAGYGGAPIIEEVELSAKRGHLTAVVGPNGAGKSTLLKVIAGLLRPLGGRVTLGGVDITGMPAQRIVRQGLSYVPQVANVFPSLSVRENLEMGGYARPSGLKEKVAEMFDMFPDLKVAAKRPARTLSGGQRTMLAIARGLMLDPAVLILDEPTAGLAPRFVDAIWGQVSQIRKLDVAILIVEQNTRRTLTNADWAYVMTLGRNRLSGTGKDLLDDPEVVDLYIGKEA